MPSSQELSNVRRLTIDPGGEKLGWAILEPGPKYIGSGVLRWPRKERKYQEYRMDLTRASRQAIQELCELYDPEEIVTEIVPSVGSMGFMTSGQGYIANVVATTAHNVSFELGIPVKQVSARSWESRIALRGRSKKITKAQIRNGVLSHLPELKVTLKDHLNEWDRWDALGLGLFCLGYKT